MTGNELEAEIAACRAAGISDHIISDTVQAARHHAPGSVTAIATHLHRHFGGFGSKYGRVWGAELAHRIEALGQPPAQQAQAANPAPGMIDFGPGSGSYYSGPEVGAPTHRGRFFAEF